MDPIKEAFSNIKKDIIFLKNEIEKVKQQIKNIQTTPTQGYPITTQPTHQQTHIQTIPPQNHPIQTPDTQNNISSIGNEGVPTDRPTHQQTHKPTQNTEFRQINNILESLDNIKKGIRLKFKRLTPQEMLVFSTLYTLEEQNYDEITYHTLSTQLNLSESSIRDYINKLIKKGVPIEKTRQNNKTIILNISKDLKNITTLSTIQDLRAL
ncbi:helix-turn-helix domain-containing protein [archaeon]|nr:helix-turn-helix domain-containing protein [archaeon]